MRVKKNISMEKEGKEFRNVKWSERDEGGRK